MAGYDPQQCLDNLNQKGLTPACQNLITPFHCDDVTGLDPQYHATCATAGIYYFPILCAVCHNTDTNQYLYFPSKTFFKECGKLAMQDPAWIFDNCYCCCSCMANDTLIATPHGNRKIVEIDRGDSVLAATLDGGDTIRLAWTPAAVRFSAGTGAGGHQPLMVYVVYGEASDQELICNMDQPFLLSDGKLTTAGKLRPGQNLTDRDGQPVPIQMVSVGHYEGGVHHLATDVPWTKNPSGHLLLGANVVIGDWALQNHFAGLPDDLKEPGHAALPLLGTSDYDDRYGGELTRSDALFQFSAQSAPAADVATRQMGTGIFKTYRVSGSDMPLGAQSFLTADQAADVLANGVQATLSNPIPRALFNTVKSQLTGFFPDILFYYDDLDVTPNIYSFNAYGQKVVKVSGGLARMQGFNYEGLFMAIAHAVGCFAGGEPKNADGYSAVGQADAFAYGTVSRLCWVSNPYFTYVLAAMKQWEALFALVSAEHAKGNPKDKLNDPGLACRIEAIQSAAAGGALPECAGGEPLPLVSLEKAQAVDTTSVTLNFSLAVDAETGENAANYALVPDAAITSAKLDKTTGFIVHLEVPLTASTDYEVTVQNLVSILGTDLDPDHVTAKFSTAAAEDAASAAGPRAG